jgi:hypothetical protein
LDNRRRWNEVAEAENDEGDQGTDRGRNVVGAIFAVAAAVLGGTLLRPQPTPAHAGLAATRQPATAEAD